MQRILLRWDLFWLTAILVLLIRIFLGPAGLLAYLIVAIYGVSGRRQAVEALLLSWFITLANSAIFGEVAGGTIGRFVVIFAVSAAAIIRFLEKKTLRINHVIFATLMLGGYILLHSLLFSVVVAVSFLKGAVWMLAMLTAILSFTSLSATEFRLAERHIYGFLVLVILLCVPAYLLLPAGSLPGYTYMRGVLGHSQATGTLGAVLAVWAFSRMIQKSQGATWELLIFGTAITTTFLTGARTGLLSIVLCMIIIGVLASTQGKRPFHQLFQGMRNPIMAFGIVVIAMSAVLSSNMLLESIHDFLNKTSATENLAEAYATSRGGLIEEMWANIRRDPVVGLGFGIASDPVSMQVQTVAGIPISAVVEKGVTLMAVWEELGLIGLALTVYWVTVILFKSAGALLTQFGLLLAILLLNFGEATLFSAGGTGLLQIVLIGYTAYRYGVGR